MKLDRYHEIEALLESGDQATITREEAFDFIDESRRRNTPLSPNQENILAAILSKNHDDDHERQVLQYGNQHRFVVRRRGTLLPSESGDTTP